MTIKEIIKISATLLGREKVIKHLDGASEQDSETLTTVDCLTRCANIVISEIAFNYIPMLKEERARVQDGKIIIEDLTEKFAGVENVLSINGTPLKFKTNATHISVNADEVKILYKYIPSNYGLTDTIGYTANQISTVAIAYGVVAEYLLTERAFSESVLWRERFVNTLSLVRTPKNKSVKGRAWL